MREGERERERHLFRLKEGAGRGRDKRSVGIMWGISEENAPVTSKAERLLKDGYNRLTP